MVSPDSPPPPRPRAAWVALTGMGLDLETTFSTSATAIGSVGPKLGPLVGPAGNFTVSPMQPSGFSPLACCSAGSRSSACWCFYPQFWRG